MTPDLILVIRILGVFCVWPGRLFFNAARPGDGVDDVLATFQVYRRIPTFVLHRIALFSGTFRHEITKNTQVNWLLHERMEAAIWARVVDALPDYAAKVAPDAPALGLNARFRCYRYSAGDYFLPHTDGSWPGVLSPSFLKVGPCVCSPCTPHHTSRDG